MELENTSVEATTETTVAEPTTGETIGTAEVSTAEVTESSSLLHVEDSTTEAAPIETPAVAEEATTVEVDNSFIDSLSEENKIKATQKGFKNVDDAMKAYGELESKLGKRIEDLTAEELKELSPRLGVPASADEYQLDLPEQLASQNDEGFTQSLKEKSLELGLPKESVEKMYKWYTDQQVEANQMQLTERQLQRDKDSSTLKQEWGSSFDEKIGHANKALKTFGGNDALAAIVQAGLDNNPAVIKMLSEAGKLVSEGKPLKTSSGTFALTPNEASKKIDALRADAGFMKEYTNQGSPGHKDAFNKINNLYKIKNS